MIKFQYTYSFVGKFASILSRVCVHVCYDFREQTSSLDRNRHNGILVLTFGMDSSQNMVLTFGRDSSPFIFLESPYANDA